MKVIVAGSRSIQSYTDVENGIRESGFEITELVSGHQPGAYNDEGVWVATVDKLGELWAKVHQIKTTLFPADWAKHGKAAGPIRNREMAQFAHALVCVYDGESRGTANMIEEMHKLGKPVYIKIVKQED